MKMSVNTTNCTMAEAVPLWQHRGNVLGAFAPLL